MKKWLIIIPALALIFLLAMSATSNVTANTVQNTNVSGKITTKGLHRFVNKERAKHNLPALTYDKRLEQSATAKCKDMVKKDYWAHGDPWKFVYQYSAPTFAGENLAYGYNYSSDTVIGWMVSPTHKDNILDSNFTKQAFGVCDSKNYVGAGEETIVVQHLAN